MSTRTAKSNNGGKNSSGGHRGFFAKKDIQLTPKRIFIDAMGSMAQGLFASLLIGTIMKTLGNNIPGLDFLVEVGDFAMKMAGPAMAVAIAFALKAPPFVLFSLIPVGAAANALGGAGGPLAVYVIALVAVFCGKLVSKSTRIDLIVTPFVTIVSGVMLAKWIAPAIGNGANSIGHAINWATNQQPLIMGIAISVLMGIALTLPISSAAICAAFGLVGLAGGAALAGCSAHMIGFAVISYKDNKMGGLFAQGLGTSMLQMPNLLKKPILWLPPIVASVLNGPIAAVLFSIKMNGAPIASGMGTSGMVGPIGVITGWQTLSPQAVALGETAIIPGAMDWIGLAVVAIVAPAIISGAVATFMRHRGWIKPGDYKIDC